MNRGSPHGSAFRGPPLTLASHRLADGRLLATLSSLLPPAASGDSPPAAPPNREFRMPFTRSFMSCRRIVAVLALSLVTAVPSGVALAQVDLSAARPGRDPKQPIDEEYTKKIREYTTEKFFGSPLVDYLPASKTVPTPKAVLGDIAGAPGKLPYSHEVYDYM